MGVECSAYTYIGVYTEDAEQYLIEKGLLKEDQLHEEYDGDIQGMYDYHNFPLQVQKVSYYSDQGSYVGFEVDPSNYKTFDGLIAKFKEITGDEANVESFEHWH